MAKYKGLTEDQVVQSRNQHGTNALSAKETDTFWSIFIGAFDDLMIKILMVGLALEVVINIASTIFPALGHAEWIEAVSIGVAIILATGVASHSEWKQSQEFNTLQEEASKIDVKLYRDGILVEKNIDEIVIGDVIQLRAGDQVPADGFILEGSLTANQASLNGESEDAKKVALGDNPRPDSGDTFNKYLLLRGSFVTSGEAVMEATTIGDNTVLGSINTALQEDDKKSPSEEKLDTLAKQVGVMGFSGAIAYLIVNAILLAGIIGTVINHDSWVLTILKLVMYAVTIIIMAVPEGLPMMTTLVSSMNARRLLAQDILVRKPKSIETAGAAQVINTDKTGTITTGKLEVVEMIMGDGTYLNEVTDGIKDALTAGLGLNNDSVISNGVAIDSNQTDRALMNYLHKNGIAPESKESIVSKEAFTSATKFASVTLDDGSTFIKGAPEIILKGVTKYMTADGDVLDFTTENEDAFNKESIKQAERSMRILAIIKEVDGKKIFIAGVCIRDNIREGIDKTVQTLNDAGISVIMITGDRKETAIAIAKDAGIYKNEDDIVLTHDELEAMTDEDVKAIIPRLKVVSRALPLDKKRLVDLQQELGLVVGMTGILNCPVL